MPALNSKLRKPLTRFGHRLLAEEHHRLVKEERPKVVDGIATAAAEGDRSENAEYIYGKKKLRELDRRIRYLSRLLTDAQVIDPTNIPIDQVAFGVIVEVTKDDGNRCIWTIVGEGETEFHEDGISWKSPVAQALWGKKVGDIACAVRPAGTAEFEIVEIRRPKLEVVGEKPHR